MNARSNIAVLLNKVILLCISIYNLSFVYSQERIFHKPVTTGSVGENLELTASLLTDSQVIEAILYYRDAGALSYKETRMNYQDGVWGGIIPGDDLTTSGLEYLIVMKLANGGIVAIPSDSPFEQPHFVHIDPRKLSGRRFPGSDQVATGKMVAADILILSPEPGEIVQIGETVIAASLFNTPNIDTTSVQVFIDGVNYSKQTEVGGGIINLVPADLAVGLHTVTLQMNTVYGLSVEPLEWLFTIVKPSSNIADQIMYSGEVSSRLSSEYAGDYFLNVSELSGKLNSGLAWINTKNSFRFTSRESKYQQSYNRLSSTIKLGDYLAIQMGDFNPVLSPFSIDGKRVRGLGVTINLPWVKFKAVQGELNRAVQWKGAKDQGYFLLSEDTKVDSMGVATYYLDRRGYTFQRSINAYQLSIDIMSKLQLGVHFLKAKDDVESLNKNIGGQATFTVDSSATGITPGTYSLNSFNSAVGANNGVIDFQDKGWRGGDPVDNLVIGFDIGTTFDKRKLAFEFSWNMSLYNRNIWNGAMSRAEMDTTLDDSLDGLIGVQYDEYGIITGDPLKIDTAAILNPKEYEGLFTINAFMTPLVPFDFASFKSHPIATVVNMPSSAFHLKLNGHYYRSNFLVEYRQIGPEYVTLGNPYLTSNIREFTMSDRVSLLDHKLIFNVGFKHRDNKIVRTTVDPLNTNTIFASVTLVPGPEAVSIMFNFQSLGKNNEKTKLDSVGNQLVDLREDSRTTNSLISINFPIKIGLMQHNLVINYNNVKNQDLLGPERRKDYVFQKTDTKSYTLNLSSRFVKPVRTILSYSRTELFLPVFENNEIIQKPYSWTAFGLNVHYALLNNKLRLMSGLSYINSAGGVKSSLYGIKLGSEYEIIDDLLASFSGSIQLNQIPSYGNDKQDNDDDGKIDEFLETWGVNNSGFLITLKYRF